MKNLSVLASVAAVSFMLSACGDDSASVSNVEREEASSSSVAVEESSSSSEEEIESSSSSEEVETPKARAATLADLEKNYSLGKIFGTEVFLATGTKQGVFSLWIPDTAWVAFHSDFKEGVLEFSKKSQNGGWAGASVPSADSLNALLENGAKIKIIVNEEEKLQYSLNDGDFKDMETAKVEVKENILSDGSKLKGMSLECTKGETTTKYSFYEGRYLAETDGEWEAGYYDIQRRRLLMLPTYYAQPVYPLTSMTVSSDFNMIDVAGNDVSCKSSKLEYEAIDHKKLEGKWVATDDYSWELKLGEDGDYMLLAVKGNNTELKNSGTWDVYGNVLLITNQSCTNVSACLTGIKGVVSDLKDDGFKLEHSNTEEPAMPSKWGMPQYE